MPGIVYILARSPVGPVQIGTAAHKGEVLELDVPPVFEVNAGSRRAEDVAAEARARLGGGRSGWIEVPPAAARVAVQDVTSGRPAGAVHPSVAAVITIPDASTSAGPQKGDGAIVFPELSDTLKDRVAVVVESDVPTLGTTVDDIAVPRSERVITASGHHSARFAPTRPITDVRAIRDRLGLTQSKFARAFGISLQTLQDWEQDRSRPDQAVRSYLQVIEHSPAMVRTALGR